MRTVLTGELGPVSFASLCVIGLHVVQLFCLLFDKLFGSQYQCNQLPAKDLSLLTYCVSSEMLNTTQSLTWTRFSLSVFCLFTISNNRFTVL